MVNILNSLVGHQDLIQSLMMAHQGKGLPHALLFVGPAGVGKKAVAKGLTQIILCRQQVEGQACGRCLNCKSVLNQDSTESFLFVTAEKNQIKLEQAQNITHFLQLRALQENRVILVDQADLMNLQAGNALLKILEEPPPGSLFILIAPSAAHVMATIRSRCQIVSFKPLSYSEMKSKSDLPDWAIKSSLGSFEKLEMLTGKEHLEIRRLAIQILKSWNQNFYGYLETEFKNLIRDRERARSLCQCLSWLLRDVFYLKNQNTQMFVNADQADFLKALSMQLSNDEILKAIDQVIQIEKFLDAHFDSTLSFEEFWIQTRPNFNSNSLGAV